MRNRLTALLLPLFIAACASSPNYNSANSSKSYGYTDTQLQSDRYRVQYRLRGDNVGQAQDFALLRAADLTMAGGDDWFRIVDRSSDVTNNKDRVDSSSFTANRAVTRECGLLGCRTTTSPDYTVGTTVGAYDRGATVVVIEVVTGNGETPAGANVYDASEIAGNIRSRM